MQFKKDIPERKYDQVYMSQTKLLMQEAFALQPKWLTQACPYTEQPNNN